MENNLFLFSLSTFPNLASRNIFCILLIFICIACRIMEILQVTSLSWFWRTLQHAWVIVLGGMTFFLFGVIELVFYLFYGSWNSHFLLKQLFFLDFNKALFNTPFLFGSSRLIQSLFPQEPNFRGRRVVTFHNQRDFIFFRHHRCASAEIRAYWK